MKTLAADPSLIVFRGKLEKLSEKKIFVPADFFFVDAARSQRDKKIQQGLAVGLALLGDSVAATSALQRSSTEIPVTVYGFNVGQERFVGILDDLPFSSGDEVITVGAPQKGDDFHTPFAVARPVDRLIALRPMCVRGRAAVLARVFKRTLVLSTLIACASYWLTSGHMVLLQSLQWALLAWGGAAVLLSFIEWRLYVENTQPIVHLTERVLAMLGVNKPETVDLVKITRKTKTGKEPPGYRWSFYRY